MSEVGRIADQLHRVFYGAAWHGPAVLEALQGVNAAGAISHPLESAHSIWEIVEHIDAWKRVVAARLRGEEVDLTPDQDWPPTHDGGSQGWEQTLHKLKIAHAELEATVRLLPESKLANTVAGGDYDFFFLLHGAIQHDAYHAGQIAMLRKAGRR